MKNETTDRLEGDLEALERFAENIAVDATRLSRKASNVSYRLLGLADPEPDVDGKNPQPQSFAERVRLYLSAAQRAMERAEHAVDVVSNSVGLNADSGKYDAGQVTATETTRSR